MNDKERAQTLIDASTHATPWHFQDVIKVHAVPIARAYLDALDEIERLQKIERAAIAVINANSFDDIEEAVDNLKIVMNGSSNNA